MFNSTSSRLLSSKKEITSQFQSREEMAKAIARKILASKRLVVLTGAGISAESGIPTFRGAGGLWRNFSAFDLATPEAFRENPSLVWQFYQYRRNIVEKCRPNAGHYAIAKIEELLLLKDGNASASACSSSSSSSSSSSANNSDDGKRFTLLTQNIDRLHQSAGSSSQNTIELHGSLWLVKPAVGHKGFVEESREYMYLPLSEPSSHAAETEASSSKPKVTTQCPVVYEDRIQPLCPALGVEGICDPNVIRGGNGKGRGGGEDVKASASSSSYTIPTSELPHHKYLVVRSDNGEKSVSSSFSFFAAPTSTTTTSAPSSPSFAPVLLRPAVVWFGESLDPSVMAAAESAIDACDVLLIIGTSGTVYPAAGFGDTVRWNNAQKRKKRRIAAKGMEDAGRKNSLSLRGGCDDYADDYADDDGCLGAVIHFNMDEEAAGIDYSTDMGLFGPSGETLPLVVAEMEKMLFASSRR